MRPLAEFPLAARRVVLGVLTDIDDTLTTRGKLTAAAYAALERLHATGFIVVPVTGRPAGWCDHIARMWPVHAVVGENGAFWMRYDERTHRLRTVKLTEPVARVREQLARIGQEVLARVPGCALASDQDYRISDLAVDYCEDVAPLGAAALEEIARLMRAAGLTVKVSSIHVNGWFGAYDKVSTARRLLAEEFGHEVEREPERWIFVGDSPNDEPMFAQFPHAVGVANIARFADRIAATPAYVTPSAYGAGFVELAEALLQAR